MRCKSCGSELPSKNRYTNERWIVIEDSSLSDSNWIQLAYHTIEGIREYRLLGILGSLFLDVCFDDDDTAQNKSRGYSEYWGMLEIQAAS